MQKVTMNINLVLKGPLLSQSSSPGELGLDLVAARKDGTFYLPATLVVGKLRQALEELGDVCQNREKSDWFKPEIGIWLGLQSENEQPKSKQLFFSDFELQQTIQEGPDLIRHRITIDESSGTIEKGQLVMIENPFISGEKYHFSGELHFFAPADRVENILKHIKTGFNWFSQVGAMKSTGFGQVVDVCFSKLCIADIPAPVSPSSACSEIIALVIRPLHPFCLSGKPVVNNLFQSESIIPGGAIIGSIATTWSHLAGIHNGRVPDDPERKILVDNFSKIRISHGFPSNKETSRPVVAPLSLVTVDEEDLIHYDVALLSKPALINGLPPDFSLDWKDNESTLKGYPWPYLRMKNWGWPAMQTERRVRTGIDRENYRSKKLELFAYEQIVPGNHLWHAQLDLTRITDKRERSELFEQLKSLLQYGIIGLGKTKTVADLCFIPSSQTIAAPCFTSEREPIQRNLWCITLQTDTLLGSPDRPAKLDECSGEAELRAMYKVAWKDLSNGKLELVRYFARQKMSGGGFRKNIFQKSASQYRPWFLTEAGSVFILRATGKIVEGRAKIDTWLRQGLPLTENICNYYNITIAEKDQWQDCPFLPQNGYGEIAVNIDTVGETKMLTDEMAENTATGITVTLIDQLKEEEN